MLIFGQNKLTLKIKNAQSLIALNKVVSQDIEKPLRKLI